MYFLIYKGNFNYFFKTVENWMEIFLKAHLLWK